MSVFGQHKNEWMKRFPECELLWTWAEDVRTNLEKHRNKVAVLKEELEKEEFYVKYLEDLLRDAENRRKLHGYEEVRADKYKKVSANNDNRPTDTQSETEADNELHFNENFTIPTEVACHSNSEIYTLENVKSDGQIDEITLSSANNDEEKADFITVIEVNSFNLELSNNENSAEVFKADGNANKKETLQSVSKKKSPVMFKKVPPKPPPKRFSRPTSALLSGTRIPQDKDTILKMPLVTHSVNSLLSGTDCLPNASKAMQTFEPNSVSKNKSLDSSNLGNSDLPDWFEDHKQPMAVDTVTSLPDGGGVFDVNREYDDTNVKSQLINYGNQSGVSDDHQNLLSSCLVPCASFVSGHMMVDENDEGDEAISPKYSDYVNIDYFLKKQTNQQNSKALFSLKAETVLMDSDDDGVNGFLETFDSSAVESKVGDNFAWISCESGLTVDTFEADSGVYSSSVESMSFLGISSQPTPPVADISTKITKSAEYLVQDDTESSMAIKSSEAGRITMHKCIIDSILESEAIYLECLHVLIQYMKALRSTISTSQPVISMKDLTIIFHKIPELHDMHKTFLDGIRNRVQQWDGRLTIGDHFKILASRLTTYESFLQNYPQAIETIRKCSLENAKFSGITKDIKFKALKGQVVTLEDLLHKPVARVQKNAFFIHDLLKQTPESHPDNKALQVALTMTHCFLNEFNMSATDSMFPVHDRAQRHLVKNSFIVELSEGRRKLRHLFLFNDCVVCAKYKRSVREKFTYEVKWYITLIDVILPSNDKDDFDIKESSPVNVLSLKSQVAIVRDQIMLEENHNNENSHSGGRNMEKHRKKLTELQGQLVLASPNLTFRISQKCGKSYVFFLSSKFERSQWVEAITVVQGHAPLQASCLSLYELQTWITTCGEFLQTNMGSFLLKSGKDDSLVGDLHIVLKSLQGLKKSIDVYLSFEVDSYGHFFRKGKTRVCSKSTEPMWNQEFVIDLEGSNFLRILCYEQVPNRESIMIGRTTIELNKSWLTNVYQEKQVSLQDYTRCELSLRRIPSSKPCGVFGVKISLVAKKEKRSIPFLITCCVREVEKRGLHELGLYRVSGSASDVQKLRRMFESNAYEAEQLMKEMDIHSVTGLFKLYLRELPEGLFTDDLYHKLLDAFCMSNSEKKSRELLKLFQSLPSINKEIVLYLINHMTKINKDESVNKMSLQNLATVFGPTLIRPSAKLESSSASDRLASGTIDVMAQAGILYFYLKKHAGGESLVSDDSSQTQM